MIHNVAEGRGVGNERWHDPWTRGQMVGLRPSWDVANGVIAADGAPASCS